MKITGKMKIKEVLAFDEEKMITTLTWLAPEFERLTHPKLRRAMSGRVSVEQAARIARIPLTEMLYALNLAIGEDEAHLAEELCSSRARDFDYRAENPPIKPPELAKISDRDEQVHFVDLMPFAEAKRDPMPAIAKGLVSLKNPADILLLRHPFDPIPLRDMFARRGFASWTEERRLGEWFIYFYRPAASTAAIAHPPIKNTIFVKATGV